MKENEDFCVKMSILGGGMVGNLIFIHFGTKETIPDHSPTQNRHFTQKIHILAYFEGYKVIEGVHGSRKCQKIRKFVENRNLSIFPEIRYINASFGKK